MSELDNQFKGGKAPTQATSSTFEADAHSSHRADKGPTADKRPIGKKRTSVSKEFTSRIEKAKQLFGYKCIDITVNSPMQATVTLVSDAGDIYSIQFDQKASWSCPYSTLQKKTEQTRNVPCKHRLYILLCLGYLETDSVVKQYSYTMEEIGTIINKLFNFSTQIL